MSHPNSIIIYRNPMEQALWENGIMFPIICSVAVFLIVFLTLYKLFDLFGRNYAFKKTASNISLFIAAIAAIVTISKLLI